MKWRNIDPPHMMPPPFEENELLRAAARLKNGKAAGPDGIPPEIAKIAVTEIADTFLRIVNNMVAEGASQLNGKKTSWFL